MTFDGSGTEVRRRGFNEAITRFWSFAAPAYDAQFLQRWVYRPAQDEVVARLRSAGSRKVADIACGTGILADRIERELHPDAGASEATGGFEVYGVDMSDGMLAEAKARSSRVQWLKGPAEQLPFADGTLDAVVTTSAFHFFDQPAALAEFHRVLGPGGLVAVATISPAPPQALQWLSDSRFTPAHSPSPTQMRKLFEGAGFTILDQHRVNRPIWTKLVPDMVTFGGKA
jgi:ubiquinone/menaquinone biosynthesis C-methylase UbiE